MRIAGFFRTNVSTVSAVTPLMSIGEGCSNSSTEEMKGTKATELLMLANEIRRNAVSQRRASAVNANRPAQFVEEESVGEVHTLAARSPAAATDTATTRK